MNSAFFTCWQRTTIVAIILCLAITCAGRSVAAPIQPGEFRVFVNAIQDVLIPASSPLNNTGVDIDLIDVSAKGFFTFSRSLEDEVNGTMSLTAGNFFGTGIEPGIGGFELFGGTDSGQTEMTGQLSNIIKDPFDSSDPDSVVFATGIFQVPDFGLRLLDAPGGPVRLNVPDPFEFEILMTGLQPGIGEIFTDLQNQERDAFLPDGTLAAISSNRRLLVTAIPEPTSVALLSLATCGLVVRRRRRRSHQ